MIQHILLPHTIWALALGGNNASIQAGAFPGNYLIDWQKPGKWILYQFT